MIPVFDLGNVLIGWNPRVLFAKVFPGEPDRMEWFLSNVCTDAWNLEQDRGRSFADAVIELLPRYPDYAEAIRAYDERWHETVIGPIEGSVEIFRALKRHGPVYAISNWNQHKFHETRARYPFLDDFDGVVVSGEVGLLKPDRAIFDLFLSRYGLAAAECVFIDDNQANVEGARAAGMRALRFESPAKLRDDLGDMGMRV